MNVVVCSGNCGLQTRIAATAQDSPAVTFSVESDCENVRRLATLLGEIDAFSELGLRYEGAIYAAATAARLCSGGCIVPSALHRAMQVAAGLALPASASIEFADDVQ